MTVWRPEGQSSDADLRGPGEIEVRAMEKTRKAMTKISLVDPYISFAWSDAIRKRQVPSICDIMDLDRPRG